MELSEKNGIKYSINLENVCAVVFEDEGITLYISAKPFIRILDEDKEMFMEWYNAQERFKRHPLDVKPLEVKKTGKQKQEKENG